MTTVWTMCATLSEDSARRMLAPGGIKGRLLRWTRGEHRALAPVFVPYRLYKVTIDDRGSSTSLYYAIDSASGLLDPYELSAPPALQEASTRNLITSAVAGRVTRERAMEKMRRKVYTSGFFRLRSPEIRAEQVGDDFCIPYWAGFFGDDQHLDVIVIDAVRHSVEGAKVRRVIQDWLMQQPADKAA